MKPGDRCGLQPGCWSFAGHPLRPIAPRLAPNAIVPCIGLAESGRLGSIHPVTPTGPWLPRGIGQPSETITDR